MPDIRLLFANAAAEAKSLKKRPNDAELLTLYALYQQATAGDAQDAPRGALDSVGAARHEAWGKLKGMSTAEAMQKYIATVNSLKA